MIEEKSLENKQNLISLKNSKSNKNPFTNLHLYLFLVKGKKPMLFQQVLLKTQKGSFYTSSFTNRFIYWLRNQQ